MTTTTDLRRVAVIGGSGFLGSAIVARLAAAGIDVRALVRRPERMPESARAEGRGAVEVLQADVRDNGAMALALADCDAVVNAVGLYVEEKGTQDAQSFEAVHELGALNTAQHCSGIGIGRLLHISGIGADPRSASRYVRARALGEELVRKAFPQATILRPSAVFDPEDRFINTLAGIARISPLIPLFGQGETKLQPVYRGDVAEAVLRALGDPAARGRTYELGGPKAYSYRALIELIMARSGRQRRLLPVPFPLWDGLAAAAALLPKPPLTDAQVTLMKRDNVVAEGAYGLLDLGIEPTALEDILPRYAFFAESGAMMSSALDGA